MDLPPFCLSFSMSPMATGDARSMAPTLLVYGENRADARLAMEGDIELESEVSGNLRMGAGVRVLRNWVRRFGSRGEWGFAMSRLLMKCVM